MEFEGESDLEYRNSASRTIEFWGTITNRDTRAVTLDVYLRVWTDDSCEPTHFKEDPVYSVILNPGESWSSPEREWRFTLRWEHDIEYWSLVPFRPECGDGT